MTEFEIVDEPPSRRTPRGWTHEFLEFLYNHPGKWAKAPQTWSYPPSSVRQWLKSKDPRLEISMHHVRETGEYELYGRFPE